MSGPDNHPLPSTFLCVYQSQSHGTHGIIWAARRDWEDNGVDLCDPPKFSDYLGLRRPAKVTEKEPQKC